MFIEEQYCVKAHCASKTPSLSTTSVSTNNYVIPADLQFFLVLTLEEIIVAFDTGEMLLISYTFV